MKTDVLREKYLAFFESKGCVRRPSDVLVPQGDKTVLFTPAGMNQFKNEFMGIGPLDFTRATTCQKCIRTGDIGNVGVTAYHHTFFEMLGNFSFGDYFKKEAIHWAWEFLTDPKWLGLESARLSITVYLADDEAFKIWNEEVGVPAGQITREGEDENFWPASAPSQGPDGVCGPCSEIYYTPDDGNKVEIWNLVFTQFNRVGDPPDNLSPLPNKNIDTGMGLERTAAVLQGVTSNFEIDTLRPLCESAGRVVGVEYRFDGKDGRAIRRIVDHVRAAVFAIHEGVAPGSNGASYIIRLLLRRACLEGYLLGKREPFLNEFAPAVINMMKGPYPDLVHTLRSVVDTIYEEESAFLGTIERGLSKFNKLVDKAGKGGVLAGHAVFDLHQTDGFVLDLTTALAEDRSLTIDMKGYRIAEEEHRQKSGIGSWGVMAAGPLDAIRQASGDTEFLAYDATEADAIVIGIVFDGTAVDSVKDGDSLIDVVLDRSPFYGESGGQVGDTGWLSGDGADFEVMDTQKHGGLIVHRGKLNAGILKIGQAVQAEVVKPRRAGIQRAHSATHLLHHALHTVLGDHAVQRGSKVEDDILRFDFSHGFSVTPEELQRVEDIINDRIVEGADVDINFMSKEEAQSGGAMALFGEKYPDRVRVVTMGDYSMELCGGNHLSNAGQVGLCRIVSEENVAAGVRRIVATTGKRALKHVQETDALLKKLAVSLKTQPQELPRRIQQLQDEMREARKELAKQASQSISGAVDDLVANAEEFGGVKIITHLATGLDRDGLRECADKLRG
ncbi:MAG: alanine--tRNA ligase [Planctomycetaceae bacterium]|nr:alanine--tRNA ligase [Planctomycetaceae bacterium]